MSVFVFMSICVLLYDQGEADELLFAVFLQRKRMNNTEEKDAQKKET